MPSVLAWQLNPTCLPATPKSTRDRARRALLLQIAWSGGAEAAVAAAAAAAAAGTSFVASRAISPGNKLGSAGDAIHWRPCSVTTTANHQHGVAADGLPQESIRQFVTERHTAYRCRCCCWRRRGWSSRWYSHPDPKSGFCIVKERQRRR